MKKPTTHAWIEPLQAVVEDHLLKARMHYLTLSKEDLLTPPASGGWSVVQCLDHLNSYGKFYIPAVQNALASVVMVEGKPEKGYRSGWLGNYFINLMKPQNTQKFKAFKNHIPAQNLTSSTVLAEFIDQQEQWLKIFAQIHHTGQLNVRVPISISPLIRLKLGDVLGFVKAHDERHIQQADRVLAPSKNRAIQES